MNTSVSIVVFCMIVYIVYAERQASTGDTYES